MARFSLGSYLAFDLLPAPYPGGGRLRKKQIKRLRREIELQAKLLPRVLSGDWPGAVVESLREGPLGEFLAPVSDRALKHAVSVVIREDRFYAAMAKRRRRGLLNILTGGSQGRRAKKPWEGRNWRNFGLGAVPHSFAEFKRAINEGRKEKTWYEWSGLVDGKDVRLKGYEKWLQIYVVNGVDYSTGTGTDTVREFNAALHAPFLVEQGVDEWQRRRKKGHRAVRNRREAVALFADLGVPGAGDLDPLELRGEYRRLARTHHPDRNPDRIQEATQILADLNSAHEILATGRGGPRQPWEDLGGEEPGGFDPGPPQPFGAMYMDEQGRRIMMPEAPAQAVFRIQMGMGGRGDWRVFSEWAQANGLEQMFDEMSRAFGGAEALGGGRHRRLR